jgi:hypothetical protein
MTEIATTLDKLRQQRENLDRAIEALEVLEGRNGGVKDPRVKGSLSIQDGVLKVLDHNGKSLDDVIHDVKRIGVVGKRVSIKSRLYNLTYEGKAKRVGDGLFALANGSNGQN